MIISTENIGAVSTSESNRLFIRLCSPKIRILHLFFRHGFNNISVLIKKYHSQQKSKFDCNTTQAHTLHTQTQIIT